MTDNAAKLTLQDAGNAMKDLFPGRAWAVFVFPSEDGEQFHYVANAERDQIKKGLAEFIAKGGPYSNLS